MDRLDEYRQMHVMHMLPGLGLTPFVREIAELVYETGARTVLDYGCGDGWQYIVERYHEAWGRAQPYLYDPAVPQFSAKPHYKPYDAVLCTNVLEYIPEQELNKALIDLFTYSRMWVFISVCGAPGKLKMTNGANIHATIKPFEWWEEKLGKAFKAAQRRLILRESCQ